MFEKLFFKKTKTITYNAETWLKAEKYFSTIQHLKLNSSSVKFHVGIEMFLVSNTWGEYKKRYTGIHGFNMMGGVKPLSGVNLDDDEWNMLTFNFVCIKDALNSKKDALKDVFTPPKDVTDMIKVYKAEWYLNRKLITNDESGREFFSREKAVENPECRKPEPGVDYPQKDVLPEMCVDCELRHPPEDTHLMNLVLIESMDKFIHDECKANCEACQVNSVCVEIGAKAILSKQLAKDAFAWIPTEKLVHQIQDVEVHNTPLMNVVRNVHNRLCDE